MTRNWLPLIGVLLAALCGPPVSPAAAQTRITYTVAGVAIPSSNWRTLALGVSDSGLVVGRAGDTSSANTYAFLWQNGAATYIGSAGSVAYGINKSGMVAGSADVPGPLGVQPHAFVWKNGAAIDLGFLPGGTYSCAYGINDAGQVVGGSSLVDRQGVFSYHAFLWDSATGMHDLGTLDGRSSSVAYAINSAGQVVGKAGDITYYGVAYPFRWTPSAARATTGTMVALGALSGLATGVNDSGDVVGGTGPVRDTSSDHVYYPVRWDSGGGAHNLATLPGYDVGLPYAINNAGQIAGNCSYAATYVDPVEGFITYYENLTAVVWDSAGTVSDLNALIPSGSYHLGRATAINNSGQVAAQSYVPVEFGDSYLLTPSPPANAPDYSLAATPASQTVVQGASTNPGYSVKVTPSGGFTGTVTLSVSGLPAGASASFFPTATSGSSTLSVTTVPSTPAGTYTLTITGASGSLSRTTSVTLIVSSGPPPPAPPTNLTATAGNGKVALKWTQSASAGVVQNRLYRSKTSGGPYTVISTLSAGTSYADSSVTTGITYYYVVTALSSSARESAYSNQCTVKAR